MFPSLVVWLNFYMDKIKQSVEQKKIQMHNEKGKLNDLSTDTDFSHKYSLLSSGITCFLLIMITDR